MPMLNLYGDKDRSVPPSENALPFAESFLSVKVGKERWYPNGYLAGNPKPWYTLTYQSL